MARFQSAGRKASRGPPLQGVNHVFTDRAKPLGGERRIGTMRWDAPAPVELHLTPREGRSDGRCRRFVTPTRGCKADRIELVPRM